MVKSLGLFSQTPLLISKRGQLQMLRTLSRSYNQILKLTGKVNKESITGFTSYNISSTITPNDVIRPDIMRLGYCYDPT